MPNKVQMNAFSTPRQERKREYFWMSSNEMRMLGSGHKILLMRSLKVSEKYT